MVNTVRSDSRSILRSPARDDESLELIQQFRINRIDRLNERCNRRVWSGSGPEQPAHRFARTCAFDFLTSDARTINESLAPQRSTVNQSFLAQAIDDFRSCRVSQAAVTLTQLIMKLPNGARAGLPQHGQDVVLEVVGGQTELLHDVVRQARGPQA